MHTKRFELDQSVVDSLARLLIPAGYSIWGYDDWDWVKPRKERPSWRDDLMRDGFLLEPIEFEDPPVRPPQVDTVTLDELVSRSRGVLFLFPSTGILTSGMKDELFSLRRGRRNRDRQGPVPVCCWCAFETEQREPIPLDFGDGWGVEDNWAAYLRLALDGNEVSSTSLANVAVSMTRLLIEQRLKHVAKKAEGTDSGSGRSGLIRISDFHCSPGEELSRARNIVSLFGEHRNPATEIGFNVLKLEKLLRRIRPKDLDDGNVYS